MSREDDFGSGCAFGFMIGAVVMAFVMYWTVTSHWRAWSTSVDAAHYDSVSGEWTEGPRPVPPKAEKDVE